jgi:ATP-dependent DNA helicase RecQ
LNTEPLDILKQYWHYDGFRPLQEEIIRSVLNGADTLALLPTGGGKSLCFQVPALARPGLCLVISPLIALMKDQVDHLRRRNITALALTSGMSRKEVVNVLGVAGQSNCKFLYVSPERLETSLFLEYLPSLPVSLIAVDEAHCVSQWGYDFRPPYLRIAALRKELPGIPLVALTASATPEVLTDIGDKLGMKQPAVFRRPFTRSNLSYSVFKVESKVAKIIEILQKVPGSSIVYCKSRRAAGEISSLIGRQGIPAAAYHAGLSPEERSQRQEAWLKDRLRVMVCTNAFGMGIDKAAVRTVIHADVPESPEHYYQEAGRAGRDGLKSYAVLLCSSQESVRLAGMADARFPAMDTIRPVYQAVMNYLQLPAGSGKGNYYPFNMTKFVETFKDAEGAFRGADGSPKSVDGGKPGEASAESAPLDVQTVLHSIKALEQEGLLSWQPQVFLPARVRFVAGKQALYDFEKDHPLLEAMIHGLLRSYEGIIDQAVPIREKNLAYILRKDQEEISRLLLQLQAFNIIEYSPQKDEPQLYFLENRVRAEELYIDPIRYRLRKEQYVARVRTMIQYLDMTEGCRSRFLANYFGDDESTDCGVCDNCLRNKRIRR